jgi:hypothetical protein
MWSAQGLLSDEGSVRSQEQGRGSVIDVIVVHTMHNNVENPSIHGFDH